jgi:hypothetical protein
VLNKKVGEDIYSRNPRKTYIRIYDPCGWEFEIDVNNLLYILQECNSLKDKGLEGEFVYSWNGTNLILLPVGSSLYKETVKKDKKFFIKNKDFI